MQNFAYFCEPVCKQLRLLDRKLPRSSRGSLRTPGRRAEERKPSRSRGSVRLSSKRDESPVRWRL